MRLRDITMTTTNIAHHLKKVIEPNTILRSPIASFISEIMVFAFLLLLHQMTIFLGLWYKPGKVCSSKPTSYATLTLALPLALTLIIALSPSLDLTLSLSRSLGMSLTEGTMLVMWGAFFIEEIKQMYTALVHKKFGSYIGNMWSVKTLIKNS